NTTTLPTYEWEHNNTTNLRVGTQQHYQPTSRNTTTLPTYECAKLPANDFAHYFDAKIKIIHTKLQEPHPHTMSTEPVSTDYPATECHLTTFKPVTLDETAHILSKSSL
ncbi:hypothetical protein LSAT2_023072, partial [Lamellibrachia satsuma]